MEKIRVKKNQREGVILYESSIIVIEVGEVMFRLTTTPDKKIKISKADYSEKMDDTILIKPGASNQITIF